MAQLKDTTIDGRLEINGKLEVNTIDSITELDNTTDSVLINRGELNQTSISNLKPNDTGWIDISPDIGSNWKFSNIDE